MKVFGNPTIGNSQLANMDSANDTECLARSLYIAVIATTDNAYLYVNVSAVAFAAVNNNTGNGTDTTGASFITASFAVVLGLLAFFF